MTQTVFFMRSVLLFFRRCPAESERGCVRSFSIIAAGDAEKQWLLQSFGAHLLGEKRRKGLLFCLVLV
jgi:hypothetical protein